MSTFLNLDNTRINSPFQLCGNPKDCAWLMIQHRLPRRFFHPGVTYIVGAKVYSDAHLSAFIDPLSPHDEPVEHFDTMHLVVTSGTLEEKLTGEMARLLDGRAAIIFDELQIKQLPVTLDQTEEVQFNQDLTSGRRTTPITARDVNRILHMHSKFHEMALIHVSAGSPERGINDSFRARCALVALRDVIDDVLEKHGE